MMCRRLSDELRRKISALKKNIFAYFCNAGFSAAKNSRDTHSFLCIADHQIRRLKCTFLFIKRDKLRSLWKGLHNHLVASDLICIKRVKRLSELMADKIGDINNVIDRSLSNRKQPAF